MSRTRGKRVWGITRRVFRWFRITLLALVLIAALALVYLNEVGLPDFVKRRVVAALETEGLNIEFSRLRLDGYRRIAIDKVRVAVTNAVPPISLSAAKADLRFQREALKSFVFRLEALDLKNGDLELSISDTNAPPQKLQVENIEAQLRRDGQDHWTLESFEGDSLGARWRVSGSLANLAAFQKTGGSKTNVIKTEGLRDILEIVQKIEFQTPPQISIAVLGDLKDFARFKASLSMRSAHAKTPWGEVDEFFLRSTVGPSKIPGEKMEGNVSLTVTRANTPWGSLRDASLITSTFYPLTNTAAFESSWQFRSDEVITKWFAGSNLEFDLQTGATETTNLLTVIKVGAERGKIPFGQAARANFQARLQHAYPIEALNSFLVDILPVKPAAAIPEMPASEILKLGQHWRGDWRLDFADLKTTRGSAGKLSFDGDVRERPNPIIADASWGFWRRFATLLMDWRAEAMDLVTPEARIDKVSAHGDWNAPQLTLADMESTLYGGSFHLNAALDVPTRKVEGETRLDFDVKKTSSFLDPEVRGFFDQFSWEKPPRIEAKLAATLPPWTNSPANSRREILKSAVLDGSLSVGAAAYRGVTCTEASTHFYLTNFQWRFPDIVLKREEGQLNMSYTGHAFETPFRLEVRGGVDPWAALPLLSKQAQKGLKFVQFPQPPYIEGVLTGDLQTNALLRFEGKIAGTNVIVRGEPFLDLKTHAVYSNLWIVLTDPIAHRNTNEVLTATWSAIDLKAGLMYITNGFSTTDPYRFTKIIGPMTYKAIAPYVFKTPPTVSGWGIIPLVHEDDADIHFQINGDDFSYWRFNMSKVSGGLHWKGDFLDVTNLQANFYGGNLDWEGHFTFLKGGEADYRFKGISTNVDLSLLLHDLLPGTSNRLDGILNGTLVITEANTTNVTSWKGHGEAELKNGFLWDIPVFGIFSGPLDSIAPGFGRSRISRGAGTFRTEGGKVYTDDMEVRAPAFRLKYDGSVDFDGNLDAMVEAQLFRDTWIFGRAMSVVFWPLAKAFESKVTGNLSAPKSELAHIPKAVLFPLRPVQTLKELFPKDKKEK
jgi:hypothetical protein